MSGEIKPIETIYNGYRFRSRLEARWAVFFDAAGVEYEYEPQGFELPSGKRYLPDFLIHGCTERGESDMWVEVKGKMTLFDAERIKEFADGHFGSKKNWHGYECRNPIFVVDEIPIGNSARELWYNMVSHGFDSFPGTNLCPFNFMLIDGDYFSFGMLPNGKGGLAFCGADSSYFGGFDENVTVSAYRMAQQARFEHGENPKCMRVY